MRSIFAVILFFTFIPFVYAQEEEMSSPLYKLQIKELDSSAEAALKNKENSLPLKDRMQFSTHGFVILAHEPERPFSFQISDTVISFDDLGTNKNSQSATTLKVDTKGAGGYQITALGSPLTSSNGEVIKPIGTDDEQYGWGYQVLGQDTTGFTDKTYFRPVDLENWMLLSEKITALGDRSTKLNFKINVSKNISEIQYVSQIKILAIPK